MPESNTSLLLLLLLVSMILAVISSLIFPSLHKRNDSDILFELEKSKAKEAMFKSQIHMEDAWQTSKDMWAESVRMNAKAMSEKSKNVRKFRSH